MRTTRYGVLAVTLLLAAAGCDRADGPAGDEAAPGSEELMQQQMDPEVMQRVMEIQAIQQQLEPVQQQALQDEALANQLRSVQERVMAAMREEDPAAVERMERLQGELAEAQAAGDQERMQAVMMEGQVAQQEMQALQAQVLERPDIRQPVEEFEAAHRARMIEIEPQADSLLDRMDELIASLPQPPGGQ